MADGTLDLAITHDDLKERSFHDDMEGWVSQIVAYNYFKEAADTALVLDNLLTDNKVLESENEIFFRDYQNYIALCRWVSIAALTRDQVVELVRDHLVDAFDNPNLDPLAKIKEAMLGILMLDDRDLFRAKLQQALMSNSQIFTEAKMKRNDREVPGTVGNWLRDYTAAVGIEPADSVKISQYLLQGENTKKLDSSSRDRLRRLVELFERMKVSSFDPRGIVETIDLLNESTPGELVDGQFQKVDVNDLRRRVREANRSLVAAGVNIPPLPEEAEVAPSPAPAAKAQPKRRSAQEISDLYSGTPDEQKRVADFEKELEQKGAAGNLSDLVVLLYQFSNVPLGKKIESEKILGVLRLLVKNHKFDQLYAKPTKFREDFISFLKTNHPKLVETFNVSPSAPQFFRLFLQFFLQSQLRMSESAAARWGMQLSALAKKSGWEKYADLAYYDVSKDSFFWR